MRMGQSAEKGLAESSWGTTGNKCPARAALLVAVDERISDQHVSILEIKPKRQFTQLKSRHGMAKLSLVPFFAEEQKKTTTTRSGDLAAQSPTLARQGVRLVNERIGNVRRDPLVGFPPLVQKGTKRLQVAFQQRATQMVSQFADLPQRIHGRGDPALGRLLLLLKKLPGVVGYAGEKQHQVALELAQKVAAQADRLDDDRSVRVEGDEVGATEGRGVLVLFPHGLVQHMARDVKRALGEVVLGEGQI